MKTFKDLVFEPLDSEFLVGKAEIVYTGASLTGLGAIVGYMDIQDK